MVATLLNGAATVDQLRSIPDPTTPGHWQHDVKWARYDDNSASKGPCIPLKAAFKMLEGLPTDAVAVDLGCGSGRDTAALTQFGFRVVAIDGRREALMRVLHRRDVDRRRLTCQLASFPDVDLPQDVQLINASHSLHFCPPTRFMGFWAYLWDRLAPGGRICGHLFGVDDHFGKNRSLSTFDANQVQALLTPFNVEMFSESRGRLPGKHVFRFVARKPRRGAVNV